MAELADALDSGSNECKFVQVQVLLSAPAKAAGQMTCCFCLYEYDRACFLHELFEKRGPHQVQKDLVGKGGAAE